MSVVVLVEYFIQIPIEPTTLNTCGRDMQHSLLIYSDYCSVLVYMHVGLNLYFHIPYSPSLML